MHVLVPLLCPLLLRHCPLLPFLLRLLLLLHMRASHPCMVHTIRGRTRLGYRVPRAQRGSKVGFLVRPKICALSPEVDAGVNFRLDGRCTGTGCRFTSLGKQPGTGTRTSKGSVVTPSLHPEVPDISMSVSPGRRRLRHQAIDGLDEGVWNRTIGDLGAQG